MRALKFIIGFAVTVILIFALGIYGYLHILPQAIQNPKVISKIEDMTSKILSCDVKIEQPYLKTYLAPKIDLKFKKFALSDKKKPLLNIKNLDGTISIAGIFDKKIVLNKINVDDVYANISGILDLPPFKNKNENPNGFKVDIFKSQVNINALKAFYKIDKDNSVKVDVKNLLISDNPDTKYLSYALKAVLMRQNHKLNISTVETGKNTIIENKEKLVIKNSKIKVDKASVILNGSIDSKKYDFNVKSDNFKLQDALDILNTQVVANNISDYLTYFDNLKGNFNFDINVKTGAMNGKVKLNNLAFNLKPLKNLPVTLNQGNVSFDNKNIKLSKFKGCYEGKSRNGIDFEGRVNDYLKTADTDIVGNAVVTNDFAQNYLSKMVSYPIKIKGKADTRIMLKSKSGKLDLVWLYKFEKGNGFLFDGEESFINNTSLRVLVAKMHLENNMLTIKSLDYHLAPPPSIRKKMKKDDRTPILSMNGHIDLSGGKQVVRDFGLTLTKPMPSGFINMLAKQRIFKGGQFMGYMNYISPKGKVPVLKGDFKAKELHIPSQRLYLKSGEFKTDRDNMNIIASGYYRRSKFDVNAKIKNGIVFPIIVRDANLTLDDVNVEKYLEAFNSQTVSDYASDSVEETVSKFVENDTDENSNTQTFDLANLIVQKCTLKILKGNYKKIDFSNVIGNMALDKNSLLTLNSNRFKIAEGEAEAKVKCDLKKHLYNLTLALIRVNSNTIASELVNLPGEVSGKASGLLELNTDESLKINGTIKFIMANGVIAKMGLVEYTMKVAALFRNPVVMVTPSVIADLVNIPEGKFDQINGSLKLEKNVIRGMVIKSVSPELSTFITGRYNLGNQDAILRIYTRFSNRGKGAYGFLRSLSLNSLANRIPLNSRNSQNYYEAEIKELPPIAADEKDCQIFLTKVDGDIVQNNFISSLHKIK